MAKRKMLMGAIFVFLLVSFTALGSATTVYVATDGSGDYNCDGKDDHVQINQALAYIHSIGGGTVYLKSGTYSAGDPVKIGDNTELTGDSNAKLMIENNAYFGNYVPLIKNMGSVGNIKIHGFELDGNYENNDEQILGVPMYYMLIFIQDVDNIEVYDMYMHDNAYDLTHFNRCSNVSVHDNIGRNQGHEFIWVFYCDGVEVYNNDMSTQINT
ncbi:glycosyl hydrolase family 28-related protein, partial [Methanolobus sp.]|uniref:glycosyl hydrolase family 28-related protein n=1 Tax=Methanolobus sp. TaxID=1874737 RepID=UPI0025D434AC